MNVTRIPLYQFMPYGAPELLEAGPAHVRRALTLAMLALVTLFALLVGANRFLGTGPSVLPADLPGVIIELLPPPPIALEELPRARVSPPSATAKAAIPVPVLDAQANPSQSIASQDDLARTGPVAETHADGGAPAGAAPADEALPTLLEWRPVDELPVAITNPRPLYPDIAREAGVDGTVRLRALVGRDGRVLDVHIDKSVPMLDQAAADAVRRWVFKPALSNGRPVAVWVAIPVHFSLR